MKKFMKTVKKAFITFFLILFFAFVILMTVLVLNFNKYGVPQFGDTSILIIRDRISSPTYKQGDIVTVKEKRLRDIKAGDEIFTYRVRTDGSVTINVGVVGKTHAKEDAISYVNGETYSMKFVIGEADTFYEEYGRYLALILSRWGFFFVILVPTFFIFISQVYALIVEIKYGDDEEEDDNVQEKPKKVVKKTKEKAE